MYRKCRLAEKFHSVVKLCVVLNKYNVRIKQLSADDLEFYEQFKNRLN